MADYNSNPQKTTANSGGMSPPRKKRSDAQKQSEWAKSLVPRMHEARDKAHKERVAARVVPEISTRAWERIEPVLDDLQNATVDAYDLMAATGYSRRHISANNWLGAIAKKFPEIWEVGTVGLPAGGWRKVLRRKGGYA